MSQRRQVSFNGMVRPLGGLWHRFAFVLLILAAFTIMLVGKADIVIVNRLKGEIADAVTPILDVVSRPTQALAELIDQTRQWRDLQAQNARLREENKRLRRWQGAALELEAENRALRALSTFRPGPRASFVTSRVIADGGGPFVHSLMINAGSRAGVRKGMAAVASGGLVGTVVSVGNRHARVLLATDLNSQIPALVEHSRLPTVVAGNNSRRLELRYLPQNAAVRPGDRVITSGHGGMLPPGLAIGTVSSVNERGVWLTPAVDWDTLEYLRVLDYKLDGVVNDGTEKDPVYAVHPPETAPSSWLPDVLVDRPPK